MPIPSPFHSRTKALNQLQEWREWAGYFAAGSYQISVESEYFAVRNAAGLLDASPLYKYELNGPDAARLANRIMTRNIDLCKIGQIMYGPWCDEYGHVIDDGTIARLAKNKFRITAADPNLKWFQDVGYGMEVDVTDVSSELAALALQGPNSRAILNAMLGENKLDRLVYYQWTQFDFKGQELTVSRTGYTGDLGYELWIQAQHATLLWDALMEIGQSYGMLPIGLAALDMTRIEAGLLMIDVDYISARNAVIKSQKSNPYEIGLGWAVKLKGEDFVGKRSLLDAKQNQANRKFVGLDISWTSLEEEYGKVDLPPQVAGRASRNPLPIYQKKQHVGQASSIVFSPILKRYIALATVEAQLKMGDEVDIEISVEYERKSAKAKLVSPAFFNPERKKALVGK